MTLQAREQLVNSGRLIFTKDTQKQDLLDPRVTRTELIALLANVVLLGNQWFQVTAVYSDHHDDTALGAPPLYDGTHFHGWAMDGWPNASGALDDFLDARDPRFGDFLRLLPKAPYYFQTGLAGSAWTNHNRTVAGGGVFHDDGADHVHIGAHRFV